MVIMFKKNKNKQKTELEARTSEFCFLLPFMFGSQPVSLPNPTDITSREHGFSLILLECIRGEFICYCFERHFDSCTKGNVRGHSICLI